MLGVECQLEWGSVGMTQRVVVRIEVGVRSWIFDAIDKQVHAMCVGMVWRGRH